MKINRTSKKWKELYRQYLLSSAVLDGVIEQGASWYTKKLVIDRASSNRIKEAEKYADRLFSAMR